MQVKHFFMPSDATPFSGDSASVPMVTILPATEEKPLPSKLTILAEFAKFGDFAKVHGPRLSANLKGEIFQRHRLLIPPGLLQYLRETITAVTERRACSFASFVWSAQIDGRPIRVIDPQRQAKPEFLDAMQRQFGKDRVGSCVRLWPEENRDE